MASIENFIDAMIDKDHVRSNEMFADIIGQKVDAALDAEKIAVASQVFNGVELDDEDFSDEELEAAADEALEDEDLTEYEFDDDFEEIQDMNQETKIDAMMSDEELEDETV